MIFMIMGIILIALSICSAIMMLFPKFDEKPVLGNICLYSLVVGLILVGISACVN